MAEEVVVSFEDALGKLGGESPAFIGRILFSDYIAVGETVQIRDEDENPESVIVLWSIGQYGAIIMNSPPYDPVTRTFTISNPSHGLGPLYVMAGCFY